MEILMSQCTTETTQTTMDTTLTTTFLIFLAKTFTHTICKLQHEIKIFDFTTDAEMKQLKQIFFRLTTRMF